MAGQYPGLLCPPRSLRRGTLQPLLIGLALGLAACGGDDNTAGETIPPGADAGLGDAGDAGGADEDVAPPPALDGPPVAVDTTVAATTVQAGQDFDVTCMLLDAEGAEVAWPQDVSPLLAYAPQDSLRQLDSLRLRPEVAGTATVQCQVPSLSLLDASPVELTIEPGPVQTVVTDVSRSSMVAGQSAEVSCTAYDAFGNTVDDARPSIQTSPTGAGMSVQGTTLSAEVAGLYDVTCDVDGAQELTSDSIEVLPSLPASLTIARVPDQPVYDTGQVVSIESIVTDEFGNPIPWAVVDLTTIPTFQAQNALPFGDDRFKFNVEDTYDVTARVAGPTLNDQPLEQSTQVVVNGVGPSINCKSPADNAMIGGAASPVLNSTITFEGSVSDVHGVSEVRVNNSIVTTDPNGNFSVDLPVGFGINFVDIQTKDAISGEWQQENSTTCAFLASDKYHPENSFLDGGVGLRLAQEAVDDRTWDPQNLSEQTDSLNDLLLTAIYSDGIEQQIDAALSANGGTIAQGQSGCVFGLCAFSYRIDYRDVRINGPHNTQLNLLNGGLELVGTLRNVELDVFADTNLGNYDITVDVSEVDIDVDFDFFLENGSPKIAVRSVDRIEAGNIGFNSSLPNLLDSLIESLAQGTLRSTVEDQLEAFITNDLNALLDGVVGSLDVSSLGSTFPVPRFDGSAPLGINFDVRFSSLGVDPQRALFGLGARLTPNATGNATPSKGVAMPTGPVLLTSSSNRPLAASVHVGLLNKALHAVWRGGLLDADVAAALGSGGFPEGTTATISTALPPVASIKGSDKVVVYLGGITLDLTYPGLFEDPVTFKVGGVAETGIVLANGNELEFQNINISTLYFSPVGISIDNDTRAVLEDFLSRLLQGVFDQSLNNALPALPVPSFTLPPAVNAFGLPGGRSLGLVSPALGGTTTHLLLQSEFGLLP